jgi:tRNA (guanine37-N1)-methyltransferase
MKFDIVTIFPRMVEAGLSEGGRGEGRAKVGCSTSSCTTSATSRPTGIAAWTDVPYGGGPGMVMKPEPLVRAGRTDS